MYSCCAQQKVAVCLHPVALSPFSRQHCPHLFKAPLPSRLIRSLPCSSPNLICAFPSFHLAFLWEGCRQTRKSASNMKLLINVLPIHKKMHVACRRLGSESEKQMMHHEVREYVWQGWNSSSNNPEFQTITGKQLLYGSLKGFQNTRKRLRLRVWETVGKNSNIAAPKTALISI